MDLTQSAYGGFSRPSRQKDPLQGADIAFVQQVFFAATGVSDGDLLRGVRYFSGGASTNSIVMRASSGTGEPPGLALGNYQGLLRRLHKEGTYTC